MSCLTCGNKENKTSEEIKLIQQKYLKQAYPDGVFEENGVKYAIKIEE